MIKIKITLHPLGTDVGMKHLGEIHISRIEAVQGLDCVVVAE